MNQYGEQAMNYWKTRRPTAYAKLDDPTAYFTNLGNQALNQIDQLAGGIETRHKPAIPTRETYWDQVGRIRAARMSAEEIVMQQLVYELEPEIDEDDGPPDWRDEYLTESTRLQEEMLDDLERMEDTERERDLQQLQYLRRTGQIPTS